MIDRAHVELMARYNAWMNERLFATCAALPEPALHEDRGAFFGSIYRTLSHIAACDESFLAWFTGAPGPTHRLGVDLYGGSFERLRQTRSSLDARLSAWATAVEADALAEPVTYRSGIDGKTRTLPRWMLVVHMFNHQTHHRGQVTTLLSQSRLDMGSTDLPFMPGFEVAVGG